MSLKQFSRSKRVCRRKLRDLKKILMEEEEEVVDLEEAQGQVQVVHLLQQQEEQVKVTSSCPRSC